MNNEEKRITLKLTKSELDEIILCMNSTEIEFGSMDRILFEKLKIIQEIFEESSNEVRESNE